MSLDIFWFLPTSGDTRYLGTSDFGRAPTNEYLRQIAVTSETLGYDGLLIPTGAACQDPWVVAASLVPVTRCKGVNLQPRTATNTASANGGSPP